MNFSNILNHIAETDPEVYERLSPRRKLIKNGLRSFTLATLPLALGSLFYKAYGKNTSMITDVLNFALTLELLESEFYKIALEASVGPAANDPLIPSGLEQSAIYEINGHEYKHVYFLQQTITALGDTPVKKPKFDFTANGAFPTVFEDYDLFLALAQAFEDTGVRAYKGAAPSLQGSSDVLTAALRIHSTEARHAAHIRTMRRDTPSPLNNGNIKPWITGSNSNINDSTVQPSYNGEENTLQDNIQIMDINGLKIDVDSATESFDEPLDMAAVLKIVSPFIVS